jgi:hypothetical protein
MVLPDDGKWNQGDGNGKRHGPRSATRSPSSVTPWGVTVADFKKIASSAASNLRRFFHSYAHQSQNFSTVFAEADPDPTPQLSLLPLRLRLPSQGTDHWPYRERLHFLQQEYRGTGWATPCTNC